MARIMTFQEFCDEYPFSEGFYEGFRVLEQMLEIEDAYADYLDESYRLREQGWLSESCDEDSVEFHLEFLFELQQLEPEKETPG